MNQKLTKISTKWGTRLVAFAAILWIIAILIFRTEVAGFGTVLQILMISFVLATGGLILSIIALWNPEYRKTFRTVATIILAGALTIVPLYVGKIAITAPPIHDITTDLDNPPIFHHAPILRKPTDNSLDIEPDTQDIQRKHYPDIMPYLVTVSPNEAFVKALSVVALLGWDIANSDTTNRQIEAIDRTLLFGFTDDIVLRVRPHQKGSVIDIRSASRIGISDLGVNASRIRQFMREWDDYIKK